MGGMVASHELPEGMPGLLFNVQVAALRDQGDPLAMFGDRVLLPFEVLAASLPVGVVIVDLVRHRPRGVLDRSDRHDYSSSAKHSPRTWFALSIQTARSVEMWPSTSGSVFLGGYSRPGPRGPRRATRQC